MVNNSCPLVTFSPSANATRAIGPATRDFTSTLLMASTFPAAAISRGTSWIAARAARTGISAVAASSLFAATREQPVVDNDAARTRTDSSLTALLTFDLFHSIHASAPGYHRNAAGRVEFAGKLAATRG